MHTRALSPHSSIYLVYVGITGSIDSRQLPGVTGIMPSYTSLVATVKTTQLGVGDRTLTDSELLRLVTQPVHCALAFNVSRSLPMATYRCLLKMQGCKLEVKQPPVLVHKRVQQLLPAFSNMYHDVFSPL